MVLAGILDAPEHPGLNRLLKRVRQNAHRPDRISLKERWDILLEDFAVQVVLEPRPWPDSLRPGRYDEQGCRQLNGSRDLGTHYEVLQELAELHRQKHLVR